MWLTLDVTSTNWVQVKTVGCQTLNYNNRTEGLGAIRGPYRLKSETGVKNVKHEVRITDVQCELLH